MNWTLLICLVVLWDFIEPYNPLVKRQSRYNYIRTIGTGRITGKLSQSSRGRNYVSYYGIPYAKPPVNTLRFKDPIYMPEWTGMRNGSIQPPICSQITLKTSRDGKTGYIGREDCLYLNVFTPEAMVISKRLPVMVFFHGGSFYSGSSHPYEGGEFLNKDVILVVVQYRLGVLGFLTSGDKSVPGNFGLKDQAAALHWVQENIKFFGGDKDKVTIFGSGAGAASVHYLVLSDRTTGLFSRAIMQSGNALCHWAQTQDSEKYFLVLANYLGCEGDSMSTTANQEILTCLQKVDAKTLTKAIEKFFVFGGNPLVFGPVYDGDFLPANPELLVKEGLHQKVDIMIGTTKDDGAFLVNGLTQKPNFLVDLWTHFPILSPITLGLPQSEFEPVRTSQAIYDYFIKTRHIGTNIDRFEWMMTENHFRECTDRAVIFHSQNLREWNKTIYSYQFDYYGSRASSKNFNRFKNRRWVSHGDELFYLFPMSSHPVRERSLDKVVKSDMVEFWVNFATYGNPTPDNYWKPVTPNRNNQLIIDLYSWMSKDRRSKERKFWKSLRTKQNVWLFPKKIIEGFTVRKTPSIKSILPLKQQKKIAQSLHSWGLVASTKWPQGFL